jgi:hypothetical protein
MFAGARGLRRVAISAVLIGLLLIPLALGVHHHGNHQAAPNCAVCVAGHFSPVQSVSGVAVPTVVVLATATPPSRTLSLGRCESPVRAGRAPPSFPDVSVI